MHPEKAYHWRETPMVTTFIDQHWIGQDILLLGSMVCDSHVMAPGNSNTFQVELTLNVKNNVWCVLKAIWAWRPVFGSSTGEIIHRQSRPHDKTMIGRGGGMIPTDGIICLIQNSYSVCMSVWRLYQSTTYKHGPISLCTHAVFRIDPAVLVI